VKVPYQGEGPYPNWKGDRNLGQAWGEGPTRLEEAYFVSKVRSTPTKSEKKSVGGKEKGYRAPPV